MSKSITEHVLATAKKREDEQLKELRKAILTTVENCYNRKVEDCSYNEEVGYAKDREIYFPAGYFKGYDAVDIRKCVESLGFYFILNRMERGVYIPEWDGKSKKTPAQCLYDKYITDLNCKIRQFKEQFDVKSLEYCTAILEKLRTNDFKSTRKGDCYNIEVRMEWKDCPPEVLKKLWDSQVEVFLEKQKFYGISVSEDCRLIRFCVRAE